MKWPPRPLSQSSVSLAAPNLVIASLIDWAGNGLYLAVIPVYVTSSHGVTSAEYGVIVSVGAMMGFTGSVPIGFFADRFGPKRVLLALEFIGAIACAALSFSRVPISVFVFIAILLMTDRGIAPLVQSLVGSLSSEDRRVRTMAIVRTSGNVGVALGGLGAAAALAVGSTLAFRIALLADAASFAGAAILIGTLRIPGRVKPVEFKRLGLPWSIRDPKFTVLSVLNGFLGLHKPILLVALPLWIVHRTRAPHVLVAVVFVLNSVLVVLLQIPASRGRESMPGAGRALWQSAFLTAAACVLLPLALHTPVAALVMITLVSAVLITLGELTQSVGAWAVSFALAPEDQRSMYLAVFGLGNVIRDVVGPVLVTALAVHAGSAGWLVIASILVISGVITQMTLRSSGRAGSAGDPVGEEATRLPNPS